jgi:hypothetical protein
MGFFTKDYKFCAQHQKECEKWLNDSYAPQDCIKCSSSSFVDGEMEMTDPPTSKMKVYRCSKCEDVRIMRSASGLARIIPRYEG